MTAEDRKILFLSLGFVAVLLRDGPKDRQAGRALAMAKLIEAFTMTALENEKNLKPANDVKFDVTQIFAGLVDASCANDRVKAAMTALQQCIDADDMMVANDAVPENIA